MSLIWPAMLASLLLLPLLVALYLRVERRRYELAARFGGLGLSATGGVPPGRRRHLPPALYLAGLAILCVALARPQMELSLPRLEGTVMLVFDVSGSMAAEDMAPTRLEAAKAAAEAFVARRGPSMRVGVAAFSDGGIAVQLPTDDEETIMKAIQSLSPQRGTSLGEGILAALQAIVVDADAAAGGSAGPAQGGEPAQPALRERYPAAAIVLLSDGENNAEPAPLEVALAATDLGVRIYTVGVGSTAGATLELEGFSVHSMLDEQALQEIAVVSGGAYFGPEATGALPGIADELAQEFVVRSAPTELTAFLVGIALALLLLGGLCSLLWFNRLA